MTAIGLKERDSLLRVAGRATLARSRAVEAVTLARFVAAAGITCIISHQPTV